MPADRSSKLPPTPAFDPDAAAAQDSGIFGLASTREQSRIVLLPVCFDATTSYRPGTAKGPAAILEASRQVDLFDVRFGPVYEQGIFLEPESPAIKRLNAQAARDARPLIASGGATRSKEDQAALARVNRACEEINSFVEEHTRRVLEEGKVPGLLGGEHSTPFGAIRACAQFHGSIGLLHIDAHMDFREAFEGFAWSHASIMHNVLERVAGVTKLVQVGIRDVGEREVEYGLSQRRRVATHFDTHWGQRLAGGASFLKLAREAIRSLPELVYVSFDIDALEPSMCPNTGTPVPGGLGFNQAVLLLGLLRESGRRVVGFDLVEVAPGSPESPPIDGNVGARVLYALCGAAVPAERAARKSRRRAGRTRQRA